MHVRGSSLSNPKVVEALRPFIVAFWGQANDEPIPADVRPLYAASAAGGSNVRCFMLDDSGRLIHSFNGFPGRAGTPVGYSPEQYAAYFASEIHRGAAGLSLPRTAAALKLPDVPNGVRLFIRLPNRPDAYGYPVVETVEDRGEWKLLARPEKERAIEARALSRWLRLCYPPGVNEQLEPFASVRGTLALKPAGDARAILSGKVGLAMTESEEAHFRGTLEAVVTYGQEVNLRGVLDGIYWRWDPPRNRWVDWRLTAAIESRPR